MATQYVMVPYTLEVKFSVEADDFEAAVKMVRELSVSFNVRCDRDCDAWVYRVHCYTAGEPEIVE